MGERPARYRLRLFTWIFIGFFVGSLASMLLIGLVALRGADNSSLDVARSEMRRAVELAARTVKEPHSQADFVEQTKEYMRGLVLYEPGPLTFTLADFSGRIEYTTPSELDGKEISKASLRIFRSSPKGSTVLYLPLRRSRYLIAWQRTDDGYLSALSPEQPLLNAMFQNLLRDVGYSMLAVLAVALGTALIVGLLLSRGTRRLLGVRDAESADALVRRSHIREVAEIAGRWGDVLRRERVNVEQTRRAFAWRDRLTSWLAAASSSSDHDLPSLAQRIVDQLPFPIAQLSLADPRRNVSYPLAMRGFGHMDAHDLTLPLDPPAGLVSYAYQERRTIRLPQDADKARLGMPEALGTRAAVAVPLIADGAVRGVLTVAVHDARELPPEAVQSLEQVGPLLGAMIARQEAVDRLRRQERLFSWVQDMNPLLLTGRGEGDDAWWPPVARALKEIVGARAAIVLLRQGEDWRVSGSFGPGLPLLFAGTAIKDWIRQIVEQPERFFGWHEEGALSIGGVGSGNEPQGVLLVLAEPDEERLVLLRTLFDYLALANQTAARREAVEELARTDPLTGVLNRRALEEHFEARLEDTMADHGQSLLFVLLDLDDFKALNDREGHAAGDLALREFGHHLRLRLRGQDAVGRIGGDEFVMLLQDADSLTGERLKELLKAPVAGGLEASYGSAVVPGEAQSFAEAYRLADRRMYAMKRGRKPQGELPHDASL